MTVTITTRDDGHIPYSRMAYAEIEVTTMDAFYRLLENFRVSAILPLNGIFSVEVYNNLTDWPKKYQNLIIPPDIDE